MPSVKAAKTATAKTAKPAKSRAASPAKAGKRAGAPAAARSSAPVSTKRPKRSKAKAAKPEPKASKRPPARAKASAALAPLARRAVPEPPQSSPRMAHRATATSSSAEPRTDATGSTLGKYVYCVVYADKPLSFGPLGIGADPADVHTVNYRDIAAVVSDTPIAVHEPTRANVLAHERVNETVMRERTVIPMSFGTVFKTREDIHELLRSAYDAFKDVLVKMEDKLEFGLKVLWDRDVVLRELENENEDIRRLKNEITTQKGSTYFARMQYGRLVDAALQSRSERYVQDIFDALRPVSVASRANKPIGDRMILNAAFLVRRDREPDFDAVVKRIGGVLDKLTFKYTGPWPPYNFVNIRLKLERA